MITTLQKWGNSQGVRIPKVLIDKVNWKENEQIKVETKNDKIIIEKVGEKRKNIKELFANYKGNYKPETIDWGETEGLEIW